jgi:hypothetical protein
MKFAAKTLNLYEAVCFVDDPALPRDYRDKDLVFIVRAASHGRAAQLADKALQRKGYPDTLFCRSVRHIGHDLHGADAAGERILYRTRKTLAINLGYPEWTRSGPESSWVFIGPCMDADRRSIHAPRNKAD